MQLKTGHLLAGGRYRVERVLGQGGFGITYLAEQTGLSRKVAVKEFFMREYCERVPGSTAITQGSSGSRGLVDRFREKFVKEARSIARLKHKNIVRIIDIFEDNNTAYYVMEYVGGGPLSDKANGRALPEADAVRYIRQLASALDYIHGQRMMHLDVKPSNVLVNGEDEAVLIDFGLSKQYDSSGAQTSSTPVGISHGYAPLEQYKRGGVGTFSPATDIYSLGATFYKLLTGETPPEAGDVNDEGLPALPEGLSAPVRCAVEAAMQPRRKDRPQSVGEFLALLENGNVKTENGKEDDDGATVVVLDNKSSSTPVVEEAEPTRPVIPTKRSAEESQSAEKEKPTDPVIPNGSEKSPKKPSGKKWFIIAAVAIIAVVAVILGINSGGGEAPDENVIVFNVNDVEFKMVAVDGGTFQMGTTSEQLGIWDNEKPVHDVTLSSYYIGETEVTQALWEAVMDSSTSESSESNNPVDNVSYDDCIAFIDKLNSLLSGQLPDGREFRLPTEAEWEFAARGGNSSRGYQYSGSNSLGDVAWYFDNANQQPHPVKQKQPNELGLYDMSGNVSERCYDWYGNYTSSLQINPKGPSSGFYRVLRGGDWNSYRQYCRVAFRSISIPDSQYGGLRLAL